MTGLFRSWSLANGWASDLHRSSPSHRQRPCVGVWAWSVRPVNVKYSPEIAAKVCELLATDHSEVAICEMPGMPSRETLRLWRRDKPEFLAECARAREEQADCIVDKMAKVEADVLVKGEEGLDPQAAKVALSSMQWRAEKLGRARYGARVAVDHHVDIGGKLDEARARVLAASRAAREDAPPE